jgi:hypothetical protein
MLALCLLGQSSTTGEGNIFSFTLAAQHFSVHWVCPLQAVAIDIIWHGNLELSMGLNFLFVCCAPNSHY